MIKRNIVSGVLLFLFSVTLGPYLVTVVVKDRIPVAQTYGKSIAALGEAVKGDDAAALTSATADAVLADAGNNRSKGHWNGIKGAHAHGNLEGILNIVVGLFLGSLAIASGLRLAISWGFIAGSWLHSGAWVLGAYGFDQVLVLREIGAPLILLSLAALLYAVITGIKSEDSAA